jgi:two-component system nitrate/nitrite response regulator NarL
MIKILLADDHKMITDGLLSFLEKKQDIEVVGVAKNGLEVLEILKKHPDTQIAVLDIEMPEMDGVETTEKIRRDHNKTKVLILSMYKERDYVMRIMNNGASGYILKNKGADELVGAIYAIAKGSSYVSNEIRIVQETLPPKDSEEAEELTKREREILCRLKEFPGETYEEVAQHFKLKISTVHTHMDSIRGKIKKNSKAELIMYAVKKGICEKK